MIVGSLDYDDFTISSLVHTGLIIHEKKLRNSFSKSLTPMVSILCQNQWCNLLMFIYQEAVLLHKMNWRRRCDTSVMKIFVNSSTNCVI